MRISYRGRLRSITHDYAYVDDPSLSNPEGVPNLSCSFTTCGSNRSLLLDPSEDSRQRHTDNLGRETISSASGDKVSGARGDDVADLRGSDFRLDSDSIAPL